MKMSKMLMIAAILMVADRPALAEQGWADSPDFTVNAVPEPVAAALFVLGIRFAPIGYSLFVMRRRAKREMGKQHLGVLGLVMLGCLVAAQTSMASPPVVTNVTAQQQAWPSFMVDIHYDVFDADGRTQTVVAAISTNSGAQYNILSTNLTGDIGYPVLTGVQKHIVWDAGVDLPGFTSDTVRVRVTADDGLALTGMVLIPAGSFTMGNCMDPSEGYSSELPVHTVMVSAFYMDRCAVSYTVWTNVYTWATGHGYAFDHAGSGKAPNHPVQTVSWYDCVKWCNARSEKEGRTPCYYTNAAQTLVYRGGQANLSNDWVNWSANGYRLPTEAEWEKAARGGTPGHRFPWSDTDTIQHARANYYSFASYTYDTSPTRGFHPTFNDGVYPYTSPVGYFAPNGYGVYDMAGNVWQWTWDWYDGAWYNNAGATQSDTRGPTSSSAYRVLRGGGWSGNADYSRCADRGYNLPVLSNSGVGFRCVRGL